MRISFRQLCRNEALAAPANAEKKHPGAVQVGKLGAKASQQKAHEKTAQGDRDARSN